MKELRLLTDAYRQNNDELLSHIPEMRVKFRDNVCFSGQKYSYDNMSKVIIEKRNGKYSIVPKIFQSELSEDTTGVEYRAETDYLAVYTMGMLEILNLAIKRQPDCITELIEKITEVVGVLDSINDANDLMRRFSSDEKSEEDLQVFNTLITLRKDYSSLSHNTVLEWLEPLVLVWAKDKAQFWQIWFEIMNFCQPFIPVALRDIIPTKEMYYYDDSREKYLRKNKKSLKVSTDGYMCYANALFEFMDNTSNMIKMKEYLTDEEIDRMWEIYHRLDKGLKLDNLDFEDTLFTSKVMSMERMTIRPDEFDSDDLHFKRIGYTVVNKGKKEKHYITDCRGVGVNMCIKLYLQLLQKFGQMNTSKPPHFDYKKREYVDFLSEVIIGCLGDDLQSKILTGNKNNIKLIRCSRGMAVAKKAQKYEIVNEKTQEISRVVRDYYEDSVLFSRIHKTNYRKDVEFKKRNLYVNYTDITKFLNAIGFLILCSDSIVLETQKLEQLEEVVENGKEKEKALQDKISELEQANKKLTRTIEQGENKDSYVSELEKEIENLKTLLTSKSNIIDELTEETKRLNEYVNIISSDDDDIDEEKQEVSIEEAVDYLNNFKVMLVGGRTELLGKCNAKGWTNVSQEDNKNRLNNHVSSADFFVINAKFLGHNLVWSFEKNYENFKDTMMYYNGTNVDTLIYTCYNFVKAYIG